MKNFPVLFLGCGSCGAYLRACLLKAYNAQAKLVNIKRKVEK